MVLNNIVPYCDIMSFCKRWPICQAEYKTLQGGFFGKVYNIQKKKFPVCVVVLLNVLVY